MLRSALITSLLIAGGLSAQEKSTKKPAYLYGHDLKVRNVGVKALDTTTPRVGVEFYHDTVGNALVAISEAGHLAVVPFSKSDEQAKAEWLSAQEINIRPAGVKEFTTAKRFALEAFKDTASGKLFTISNLKTIAFADMAGKPESDKDPVWHHALDVTVRKADAVDDKNATLIGIEAYRDGNTGGLIYMTEQGCMAFAPAPTKVPESTAVKDPQDLYPLALYARKAGEGKFDQAKLFTVRVMKDPNSGAILYVSETGSLAAISLTEPKKGQPVRWSHAFHLKPRKSGEKDFDKATKYGVEVFEDKNTGAFVYISDIGSIAVKK